MFGGLTMYVPGAGLGMGHAVLFKPSQQPHGEVLLSPRFYRRGNGDRGLKHCLLTHGPQASKGQTESDDSKQ